MSRSDNFTRNLLLAAAGLQVAHAQRSPSFFSREEEARRLLELYPGSGMTVAELTAEMERMSAARAPESISSGDRMNDQASSNEEAGRW